MRGIGKDLKYAVRMIVTNRFFAAAVILSLAVGIGVNSAIFSIVDAVLFRNLPVNRPDQLVRIYSWFGPGLNNSSFPVYRDYVEESRSFTSLAAFSDSNAVHISSPSGQRERLFASLVSENYFDLLGVRPLHGRLLSSSDERGKTPVAVISESTWQKLFGRNLSAIDSSLRINGHTFTVVGILPRAFTGLSFDQTPDLWVPISLAAQINSNFSEAMFMEERGFFWVEMVGRLRPDVTIEQAQRDLDRLAYNRAAAQPPDKSDPQPRLIPASEAAIGNRETVSRLSWLLLALVVLVLMIACAVAGTLLLSRSEIRSRELAIRMAIGASAGRVARQLLVESLLLSILAGAAGLVLASYATDLLLANAGPEFPIPLLASTPVLNARVLLFTSFLSVAAAVLFGSAPALRLSRRNLVAGLKAETSSLVRSDKKITLRSAFVVFQVAVSVVLLMGAGLLVRTFWKTAALNPGFDPDNTLAATMDLSKHGFTSDNGPQFYENLLRNLRQLPGVESASMGKSVPVQESGMITSVELERRQDQVGDYPRVEFNIVADKYFRTMKIPIVSGRDFKETDRKGALPVAIVNEAFAEQFWPDDNAVGKTIPNFGFEKVTTHIVGVAANSKTRNLREQPGPMIYVPLAQNYISGMTVILRSNLDPVILQKELATAVHHLHPELPLFAVQTLNQKLSAALTQERTLAYLLSIFGGIALFLATGGLYSVVSFYTATRTQEVGIRMALGATRNDILRLILGQGMRLALIGIALGIPIALAGGRFLESWLFGVSTTDATTYAAVAFVLCASCLIASYLPARYAMRISPVRALRYE